MNPYIIIAAILAAVGSYFWGRSDGAELADAAQLREERIAEKAREAAQQGAASEIAKLEIKNVTIKQRVERETREVPVYRNCRHSPDGLRAINAALTNGAESPGGGELPGEPGAAAGR
ncbi:MAG: hypothetical protein H6R10_686 [Rhodocyclaceae bacterium]|nr:hypothetical protein [Rhodocyclaceae bacterium]